MGPSRKWERLKDNTRGGMWLLDWTFFFPEIKLCWQTHSWNSSLVLKLILSQLNEWWSNIHAENLAKQWVCSALLSANTGHAHNWLLITWYSCLIEISVYYCAFIAHLEPDLPLETVVNSLVMYSLQIKLDTNLWEYNQFLFFVVIFPLFLSLCGHNVQPLQKKGELHLSY